MKIPYSHVHAYNGFVFAARGGRIHTFNLTTGAHVSSWNHPEADKLESAAAEPSVTQDGKQQEDVEMNETGEAGEEPPAKRQRVDEKGAAKETEVPDARDSKQGGNKGGKKGKKSKDREKGGQSYRQPQVLDKPQIAVIQSTEDGKHVVAVSGHDKVLWVFEHDGEGHLKEMSQRKMPKRPVDLALSPDQKIIIADKFGDVYALPLLYDPTAPIDPSASTSISSSLNPPKVSRPSANTLTVHSKRNRKALEEQIRFHQTQAAKDGQSQPAKEDGAEPVFEISLLLGHVSMLTALTLAESEGRRYIVTADRDEHIRVSRYIPQAYVIEGFCLGHKDFVAAIVVPEARPEILVSAGGDSELFLWDWKAGARVGGVSVLGLAHEIQKDLKKVAVSSLATLRWPSEQGDLTYILAICEDIKAILSWQLTPDNELKYPGIIQLPGNPLHFALSQAPDSDSHPCLIVAIDPTDTPEAKSLNVYTLETNDGRLAVHACASVEDDSLTAAEADMDVKDVRSWLYTTEQLRKQEFAAQGEEEGDEEPADGETEGVQTEAATEQE